MAASCSGVCLDTTAVSKWYAIYRTLSMLSLTFHSTSGGLDYCVTEVYDYQSLSEYVTAWSCDSTPARFTVYDRLSFGDVTTSAGIPYTATGAAASTIIATNREVSYVTVSSSSGMSEPTPAVPGPNTISTTPVSPAPATPNVVSGKSGISAGAIAGIVVGAILLIVIVLGMILLYRYKKGKGRNPPQPQLSHDTTPHLTGMATVQQEIPPLSSRPSNYTMPSNTPLVPQHTNELSPEDSASNIGGPYSMVSQAPPPDVSSEVDSYPTSQSALGNLPQFSAQHGVQPVASPGTEFGSMPPVHAPDVNPGYTFVPKGPQQ